MTEVTQKMRRAVGVVMILLVTVVAGAQEQQPRTYDLERVVATAVNNHSSLRVSAAEIAAARARTRQAAAHFRPQISAEGGYTRLEEAPSFTVGDMGTLTFGEEDNWNLALDMKYPLSTGGKLDAMVDGARAAVDMAEEDLLRREQTVAINAAQAYFRALEARRMIAVLREQITALEEAVRVASAMYDQEVVAKIDVLRPSVALGGARNALQQAETGYNVALAALAETMGLPPGTPLQIEETPTEHAPTGSPDEAWEAAWQVRPEVQRLAARERAAQAQLHIARSQDRPQVGLWARSEFERQTFYPETGTLSAGVMVTQNISDGGASRAAVDEARARLEQLEAADEQLRYGIAVQVQVAIGEIESARERVDTTAGSVELAREALRLAQIGYRNGVTPMLDLLQAQAALTGAQMDHEGAVSALRQAYANFDYAMGYVVGRRSPPTTTEQAQ